jgi:hypothetical protein
MTSAPSSKTSTAFVGGSAAPRTPLEELELARQQLDRASTIAELTALVGHLARSLTGADGATVVLNEGTNCFYADEDAIGPLWKGRRFPQTSCISGWVMMYRKPVTVENIFEDPRIPLDAYRSTFVRSLVMVPVGEATPIAAIGAYWARTYRATSDQMLLLQALATHTERALQRVKDRSPGI